MTKNINDKNSPDQMRVFMKRMRTGKFVDESKGTTKHELSIRDMLKITRNLNEDVEEPQKLVNKETVYDQPMEEKKFMNFFKDMNVSVKFIDLEVANNQVFWGGTIDGIIQFIYRVTPDGEKNEVEFNYLDDFSPDNPDNDLIIKMVESYYDTFYKYWRNNMIQH